MDIETIVRTCRTVAVVGLDPGPEDARHRVVKFLKTVGYTMIPVHPDGGEMLGEKVCRSLDQIPVPVEVVQVFSSPDEAPLIAREALSIGAPVLWLQEGGVSGEAQRLGEEAGMTVIMDRCLLQEYRRLLNRLMAGGAG